METKFEKEILEKEEFIKDLETKICSMDVKVNNLSERLAELENKKSQKVAKPLTCTYCDFTTNSESGLKIHKTKKHTSVEIEPFPRSCDLCDEIFKDSYEMKKHLLAHSYKKAKFKCDECDFVGKIKATMEVHIGKHHCEKYECGLCDSEFGSYEKLEIHLKTCESYECDHHSGCDRRYQTLSDLKKHFDEKHKKEMSYFNHLKIDRNDSNEVSVKNYKND